MMHKRSRLQLLRRNSYCRCQRQALLQPRPPTGPPLQIGGCPRPMAPPQQSRRVRSAHPGLLQTLRASARKASRPLRARHQFALHDAPLSANKASAQVVKCAHECADQLAVSLFLVCGDSFPKHDGSPASSLDDAMPGEARPSSQDPAPMGELAPTLCPSVQDAASDYLAVLVGTAS